MGIIVAIDGPAGAGKSSTAREVALRLGFLYIDTGAMYRAVTLETIRRNIDVAQEAAVIQLAQEVQIRFRWIDRALHTFLNDEDVSEAIRSARVAGRVSPVSAIGGVREVMAASQRKLGETENLVMEGRDIGTNVFPQAQFKFYLNADVAVRARRRLQDYRKIGQELTIAQIVAELKKRDKIDSSREHSPLKRAADAILVDTTDMDFEDQVNFIVDKVKATLAAE